MLNLPTQSEVMAMRERSRYAGQPKNVTGKHAKLSKVSKPIAMATADGEMVTIEPKAASEGKRIAGHARPVPKPSDDQELVRAKATIIELRQQIATLHQENAALRAGHVTSPPIDTDKPKPKRDRAAYMREKRANERAAKKASKTAE